MLPEPDDILAKAWERHAQLHPVHPDERFVLDDTYRIKAPGYWLILSGLAGLLMLVVIWCAPVDLGSAEIRRTILALFATLAVGGGLVALRRHRLNLARQPSADPLEEPERPFSLSTLQLLFVLACFAAMTAVLLLTAPARLVSAVPMTALFVLLVAILLTCTIATSLHALRWRLARRAHARRYDEPDLGYFEVWDRT
jgi:amino acid transporter